MVTLLIVSEGDVASTNLRDRLLERIEMAIVGEVEGRVVFGCQKIRMWSVSDSALFEDKIDRRYSEATGESITDAIFLSRHSAASGRPCLSIHPIGLLNPLAEPKFGGRPGRLPPPNLRISAWIRWLGEVTSHRKSGKLAWDVSLEATHHGPWLDTPSMFVEIGSTEAEWVDPEPARIWAEVLAIGLGLEPIPPWASRDLVENCISPLSQKGPIVLCIGGGHYAPRHADMVHRTGSLLGHIIPGWAFSEMKNPDDWIFPIRSALESTRLAAGGREIVVHLDRKSFRSSERQHIVSLCASLGLLVVRSRDLLNHDSDTQP